jgi:hypothetical protein
MELSYKDAVQYTLSECQSWLRSRDIAPHTISTLNEWDTNKPWYRGYINGVRIDKFIIFHPHLLDAKFAHNPYGIPSPLYWFILAAMMGNMIGHLVLGFLRGVVDADNRLARAGVEVFGGFVSALPMVWMASLFMFPALIANVQDQYAVMGHKI